MLSTLILAWNDTHSDSSLTHTTITTMKTMTNTYHSVSSVSNSTEFPSSIFWRFSVYNDQNQWYRNPYELSLPISAESYHKVMIPILFFRSILTLSNYSSFPLSVLTAKVVLYFDMLTGSPEREVEGFVKSIHHDFFWSH